LGYYAAIVNGKEVATGETASEARDKAIQKGAKPDEIYVKYTAEGEYRV